MNKHLKSIKAGEVTKSNVIGIRKAINATERRERGYSVSSTCPKLSPDEVHELEEALAEHEPKVVGELHTTGLKLLRSPRYRKKLAGVRDVIDTLESFRLVGFERIGRHCEKAVPVYRACGRGKSFVFYHVPWQAGGTGPEIIG